MLLIAAAGVWLAVKSRRDRLRRMLGWRLPFAAPDRYRQQRIAIERCQTIAHARLFNTREVRVFYAAQRAVASMRGYHVHGQVSLGEIINWSDPDPACAAMARRAINSKRVDILITDPQGWPALAIEHQGSGHLLRDADIGRNAVKALILRRACIALLETFDHQSADQLEHAVRTALQSHVSAEPEGLRATTLARA